MHKISPECDLTKSHLSIWEELETFVRRPSDFTIAHLYVWAELDSLLRSLQSSQLCTLLFERSYKPSADSLHPSQYHSFVFDHNFKPSCDSLTNPKPPPSLFFGIPSNPCPAPLQTLPRPPFKAHFTYRNKTFPFGAPTNFSLCCRTQRPQLQTLPYFTIGLLQNYAQNQSIIGKTKP